MAQFHHIVIDNFSHDEKVTYPLIILKGHLDENTEECPNACKDYIQKGENIILYHSDVKKSCHLSNGQFKFILNLDEGDNNITIKYCCDNVLFTLTYLPRKSEYTVYPLYIICDGHDGNFQAPEDQDNSKENACKRINLICRMLQCVTAEKLYEKTLSRKTFVLADQCQIFNSKINYIDAGKMDEKQLWTEIAREIMRSDIGCWKKKYLGFLSCTRYRGDEYQEVLTTHRDLVNITDAYIALGGGGLALFGSASIYTWPSYFEEIIPKFEDSTFVDKSRFLDDSCYRGTLGACFSTSLGSVLHELSHTFDLGHTNAGIMSRGFDNIYKVFTGPLENDHKISMKFHKTIEFKESLEPELLSERLKIKPKEYQVTGISRTEKDADDTFWTKSCATILNYHKWFNNFPENIDYVLKFDSSSKAFLSTAGLRVVELRRINDETVLADWVFDGKILKYSFQLPTDLDEIEYGANILIFASDNVGNILKFAFE